MFGRCPNNLRRSVYSTGTSQEGDDFALLLTLEITKVIADFCGIFNFIFHRQSYNVGCTTVSQK